MSRRKPEKKPEQLGSIFSVPIDLKPGVVLPGAAKHAKGTVPLGLYLDSTGGEFYFYVDMYYGPGNEDEGSYITTDPEWVVRISVQRVLDATERKDVSFKTMSRLASKLSEVTGTVYSMDSAFEKNNYQCGFPKSSRYDYTLKLGAEHTSIELVRWDDEIFPAMWSDGSAVGSGESFTYPPEIPEFKWEKLTDSPFRNGFRFKVTRQ